MRPTAHKNTMQTTTDDGARDPEAVQLMPVHASGPLSPTAQHLAAVAKQPHQARWLTPEFLIYIGYILFLFYQMFSIVLGASNHALDAISKYPHLKDGWMFGRKVDVSDGQYRFFRKEIPLLTLAATGFLVLSQGTRVLTKNSLPARLAFYSLFSLGFLLFCHGSTIAFMLIIVGINFAIGWIGSVNEGRLGTPATAATWIFNCLILLANERYRGYSWHDVLAFGGSDLAPLATWLQSQRGLFPWQGLFNMVVLRMISFNLDRIWCSQARPTLERDGSVLTFGKHQGKCTEGCKERGKEGPCPWWREKEHHRAVDYTFLPYFCYLFYVPLHFAGPTMTFNSWLSCVKTPQQTYSRAGLVKYTLLRVAFIFLVLEWWLHYCYVFTLTNHKPTFLSLSPYAMAIVSYFTLIGIWLKFTAIWRFFRGWALLDGIEPPENMQRCVSNNYSIQSFWRAWHRSFNRWLVRYIYIPLGGGASASTSPPSLSTKLLSVLRQSFNVFLTFSFVAFWHDRTMQLLAWGWLIAVLFVPELTASAVFHMKSLRSMRSRWYARHLRGVGAALSIFMMMVANLIGYSVGIDGVNGLMQTMVEQGGVTMFVVIFTAFFSAAMVMFEFRETGITVD